MQKGQVNRDNSSRRQQTAILDTVVYTSVAVSQAVYKRMSGQEAASVHLNVGLGWARSAGMVGRGHELDAMRFNRRMRYKLGPKNDASSEHMDMSRQLGACREGMPLCTRALVAALLSLCC